MFGKMRSLGALLAIILAALFMSMLGSGQALASSTSIQAHGSGVVSSGSLVQANAFAQNYWTPERMSSARQADALLKSTKLTHRVPAKGPSGSKEPVAPVDGGITPQASPLPTGSYSSYPYSTIGKVFFTDSQTGTNYVCSGAAVNSTNLSVVDTAGHCVVGGGSGGNWYANWVFCPGYYYGSSPHGCWSARVLWSRNEWINSGTFENDFGSAVVSANSAGNLVSVVGGAGWAYGQAAAQSFTAFGYPAASPFDGNQIYYCSGTGTSYSYGSGTVISLPCDMTGGSSGGPWFISLSGTFGYVNGHNDFKYTSDPNHMYSPYYNSNWYSVFNSAQTS
jgi:V8-like Glu-specific endopeptidase